VGILIFAGAFTFSGIGLLVASKATTIETVSGLMNLVMLPMWVFSGVFFSSERFPNAVQPIIKMLPLTPLIDGLRATMLEGIPLTATSQLLRLACLIGWGLVTFVVALKLFRWT
jgi:ABC-type polysaccharide/polyol phosphate export permease